MISSTEDLGQPSSKHAILLAVAFGLLQQAMVSEPCLLKCLTACHSSPPDHLFLLVFCILSEKDALVHSRPCTAAALKWFGHFKNPSIVEITHHSWLFQNAEVIGCFLHCFPQEQCGIHCHTHGHAQSVICHHLSNVLVE